MSTRSRAAKNRKAKEKQTEEDVLVPKLDEATILSNMEKIKQKIIDTSKVLDLHASLKLELDAAKKASRSKTQECENLRSQIIDLISQHEPLQRKITAQEVDVAKAKQDVETLSIQVRSRDSLTQ